MSELILTEAERKATWAECDDKTLADVLRHFLVITGTIKSGKGGLLEAAAACDAVNLIRMAHETNAETLTITQEVTIEGKTIGTYEVVVTKIN